MTSEAQLIGLNHRVGEAEKLRDDVYFSEILANDLVFRRVTGDIAGELWARCPLLGTGEAIVSSPQLNRPTVVSMRPAASRRKFSQ